MKKAIATLSALSLVTATFITSCKKDTLAPTTNSNTKQSTGNVPGSNTVAKIQNLGSKYQSSGNGNVILRPWQQYAAADAIGALDGAGTGGAVAGLWGAVCGGITYGVFASCALDMFDMVVPNPGNPPLDGSNPSIPGTSIGVNDPGTYHNTTLGYVLNHQAQFGQPGNPNLALLKTYLINDVSDRYSFEEGTLTNIVAGCKSYEAIVGYAEEPSDYFATLGESDFRTVSESFFNTAFSITENDSLMDYYNSFVDIIRTSNDFSETQKAALITYSSIATASILYHNH